MALTVDYSGDYAHVEGVEEVTYFTPGAGSQTRSASGVKAVRGRLSWRQVTMGANLMLAPGDVSFTLWSDVLQQEHIDRVEPQGVIVDSSNVKWKVLAVEQIGVQWLATCRKSP